MADPNATRDRVCPACGNEALPDHACLDDQEAVAQSEYATGSRAANNLAPGVKTDATPQVIHLAEYAEGNVPGRAVSVCGRMVRKPTSAEMFRLVSRWCATCREAATDD